MPSRTVLQSVRTLTVILAVHLCTQAVRADWYDNLDRSSEVEYAVRLRNGELLMGSIVDLLDSTVGGRAIKLKTDIGTATIYESQVLEIRPYDELYRHAHRVFMMPTAEPIGSNHYIGNLELFALWAGIGIADVASITMARTIVPAIPASDQLSLVNLKFGLYEEKYTTMTGKLNIAAGINMGWLNASNRITNLYLVTTFTRIRSRISGTIFANISGDHSDLFTARAGTIGNVVVRYPSGAVGFAIGIDTRFPGRQDLHFIAELWNANLSAATNSALMLGLRLANTAVSLDFGIAVLTAPYVVPVCSFSWTPL